MKIFFLILAALLLIPPSSAAVSEAEIKALTEKIDRWQIEEAWKEVREWLAAAPRDPQLLDLAAQTAFHRGDYAEALRLIRAAIDRGGEDDRRKGLALFVERNIAILTPFKKFESAHFIVVLDERQDGILADYILDGLEKTYQAASRRYGFQSREKVRVEVFPNAGSFSAVSTLSARDIEVAGAVGLAHFNKLMVISPRAVVYGYRWLDALSHEFMHYLIMKMTANKAPIWFHEGLAKFEETRWRNGPSYLSPLFQTLLAQAVANDRLIKFEKMEPSLIKLETPEEIQLAYAQAASAIEFIVARAGYDGLRGVMKAMPQFDEKAAGRAIRQVLEMGFDEFEEQWKGFLAAKKLKEVEGVNIRRLKIKEGIAQDERLELSEIKSLVARNRAHLGDRLKEAGRTEAAVAEYRRALAENKSAVPILNRLSDLLIRMDRDREALAILQQSGKTAPDHPVIFSQLGRIHLKLENFPAARDALRTAIEINPFSPEVHRNLAEACEKLGDLETAGRERAVAEKIKQ